MVLGFLGGFGFQKVLKELGFLAFSPLKKGVRIRHRRLQPCCRPDQRSTKWEASPKARGSRRLPEPWRVPKSRKPKGGKKDAKGEGFLFGILMIFEDL